MPKPKTYTMPTSSSILSISPANRKNINVSHTRYKRFANDTNMRITKDNFEKYDTKYQTKKLKPISYIPKQAHKKNINVTSSVLR